MHEILDSPPKTRILSSERAETPGPYYYVHVRRCFAIHHVSMKYVYITSIIARFLILTHSNNLPSGFAKLVNHYGNVYIGNITPDLKMEGWCIIFLMNDTLCLLACCLIFRFFLICIKSRNDIFSFIHKNILVLYFL